MKQYDFLGVGEEGEKRTESKYNIFNFQNHLLEWISISADQFQNRDYPSSFESLTVVYMDTWGFLDKKEKEEIDALFETARKETLKYINYNVNFQNVIKKVKNQTYLPPTNIYFAILEFRKKLMALLARHNFLMMIVKKSQAGAGDA